MQNLCHPITTARDRLVSCTPDQDLSLRQTCLMAVLDLCLYNAPINIDFHAFMWCRPCDLWIHDASAFGFMEIWNLRYIMYVCQIQRVTPLHFLQRLHDLWPAYFLKNFYPHNLLIIGISIILLYNWYIRWFYYKYYYYFTVSTSYTAV